MTDFNGVEMLKEEMEIQNNFYENIFNNIYNKLSTNQCEYVDNINNMYSKFQNITKTLINTEKISNRNITENLSNNFTNILKNSYFADNSKGFSGYVENFVDNGVKNFESYELIHKNVENIKNLNNENTSISNENRNFSDIIRNVENSNSYEHRNFDININMGGITQNISGNSGDDALDILVEKLKNSISGCCDRLY